MCLFSLMLLTQCKTNTSVVSEGTEQTFGFSPEFAQRISLDTLTLIQVDSIITVDKLRALNTWKTIELTDFESNIKYKTAVFYKAITKTRYTVKILPNKLYIVEKTSLK